MKNAMKKLLSLALALVLVASVFPMAALAAEGDTYKVSLQMKLDESDEIAETMLLDSVMEGTEIDVATMVSRYWPDYTYSHYWTEATGKQTDAKLTITGETTVDVRMTTGKGGEDDVTPPADNDNDDDDEEAVTTYTILLNVYQIKDNEAKQWKSDYFTLKKDSTTLSELVALSGYGSYESVYAKIDGASFEGRAEIAIDDGDQVDLFITPSRGGNKNDNDDDDKKPSKGEKVTLRVFHNDGTSDYTDLTVRTTDKLLDVIEDNKELRNLSRDGYKLIGWAFEANNDKDQEWIAAQHTVADDDDLRVYADWQETKPTDNDKDDDKDNGKDEVLLRIYVNGNTKSAAKVYDMEAYDNDGKITLAEATKVVKKYYEQKSSDDDMDVDGLFTKKTWNDGDYDMDDAKNTIYVNDNGDTIIYVMVRDAQRISSGKADSTNPKTGDSIFMAVTVMALSASALALVYVFNKKRAVK